MDAAELINAHRAEVEELCRRFGVVRLQLFGSALTDRWDPRVSDLDFLVEYGPKYRELPPLQSLVGLKMELERLFERSVNVVNLANVRNPIFRRNALASAQELYAA